MVEVFRQQLMESKSSTRSAALQSELTSLDDLAISAKAGTDILEDEDLGSRMYKSDDMRQIEMVEKISSVCRRCD